MCGTMSNVHYADDDDNALNEKNAGGWYFEMGFRTLEWWTLFYDVCSK